VVNAPTSHGVDWAHHRTRSGDDAGMGGTAAYITSHKISHGICSTSSAGPDELKPAGRSRGLAGGVVSNSRPATFGLPSATARPAVPTGISAEELQRRIDDFLGIATGIEAESAGGRRPPPAPCGQFKTRRRSISSVKKMSGWRFKPAASDGVRESHCDNRRRATSGEQKHRVFSGVAPAGEQNERRSVQTDEANGLMLTQWLSSVRMTRP